MCGWHARLMKALFGFFAYLFLACVCGSLLGFGLSLFVDYPYPKLMSRSVLLFAALGLIPLWRYFGLTKEAVGLTPMPSLKHFCWWFGIGLLVILPLMWFFWMIGFRVLDPRLGGFGITTLSTAAWLLFSAMLVALFEETLFRGVIYGALRRAYQFTLASAVVSFCYASVHFLEVDHIPVAPTWWTGIVMTFSAFAGMFQVGSWDSWLSLFLLGWIFCLVRERISLWAAIALHAAFVFALRGYKELTVRDVVHPFRELVGDYDNFLGIIALGWMLFLLVLIALVDRYREVQGGSR